jgi:hypothetical protein
LDLSLAYATNTLFWMYLRVQGVAPANHPVTLELKRIREYMERLTAAKAEAAGGGEAAAADKAQQSKLNLEAAQRFIKAGLGREGTEPVTEDLWADEGAAPAADTGGNAEADQKKKRKSESNTGAPAKVAKKVKDNAGEKEKKKSKKKSSKSKPSN